MKALIYRYYVEILQGHLWVAADFLSAPIWRRASVLHWTTDLKEAEAMAAMLSLSLLVPLSAPLRRELAEWIKP